MNKTSYSIRIATEHDAVKVLDLMAEHAQYEQEAFSKEGKLDALSQYLGSSDPPFHCLVVESENLVQGYCTYLATFDSWTCSPFLLLDAIYLQPHLRGLGLGSEIMRRVRIAAQDLNCATVRWQTPLFNEIGIGFYNKLKAEGAAKMFFSWNVR